MKLDHPPVYRKAVVQWYDSELACLIAVIFLFLMVLLGLAGISVANSTYQYQAYLWVPLLLTLLSAGVIVSITLRLTRRFLSRFNGKGS